MPVLGAATPIQAATRARKAFPMSRAVLPASLSWGTQITYLYEMQSNLGHAQIAIDGLTMTADLDQYSPTLMAQKRVVYTGLANGPHTITVTVLGRHSSGSTGSYIIVDAFIVGPPTAGICDDSDPDIVYSGSWGSNTDVGRYNGTQSFTHNAGDVASFTFTGTQVAYVYETQANLGYARAKVIDGVVLSSIHEYSAALVAQKRQVYTGLSNTTHTITVTALGTKRSCSGRLLCNCRRLRRGSQARRRL